MLFGIEKVETKTKEYKRTPGCDGRNVKILYVRPVGHPSPRSPKKSSILVVRGALLKSGDISTLMYFPPESTLNHPATLQVISVPPSSRICVASSFSVVLCNASLPVRFGDLSFVRLAGRSFPMERL